MDEQPRPKRPKITRCDDDYIPGNITEIELHNFMTFGDLTCKPCSRLNLVIGPNGSGKSSLVCAIALGLCGEPQLLGRATSIGAYVKRGEESGYIKISLKGNSVGENITIMRKIDTRNRSEWLLNGNMVPKKDIVEVIQRFNIQVNNLTQFLPQDRVCEFAKLTPIQLLEETEKAVGDPQLPVQHHALITKSQELKKFERAVESNKGSLDQLKALNSELERDVERVRQREELLAKVENMKKKLPWLKYDMKKADYMESKKKEEEAKRQLDEAAKIVKQLQEPIKIQKQEKTALDSKRKNFTSKLDGNAKKRLQLLEDENRLGVQVKGKYNEMEELRRQEESRQQKISKAKEDLLASEMELSNLPRYEPPKEKIEALNAQIMELEENVREIRLQKSEKERSQNQHREMLRQCMNRLRDMESTNNKRLKALQRSGAEKIFEAYNWVQEHRHMFNKDVYGPVLLEVNVSNRSHADYLEGQVAYYIWKAFITQDSADRDLLFKNLKSFEVPIINHVEDEGPPREQFKVTHEMQRVGIYSRLDEVFDAPTAVKEVLISQFMLDHSYIGSKETDEKANEVQKAGIMDFWTPGNHYRWSKSRYGGHVSASVEAVGRSQLLLCNVDVGEMERYKARKTELDDMISNLEGELKVIQGQLRRVEDEAAELHKRREEIIHISKLEKTKRRDMENRVNQRKMKLKALEREGDVDAVIEKLTDQAEQLKMKRFKCAIEIKNLLIEAVACRKSYAECVMVSIELEAKIKDMEDSMKQQEKFAVQASMHFENCKAEVENSRQRLSAAKRHAESIAMLTPELKQAFLEMPGTIEDLDAAIVETTSQANSILFLNNNILEEYENRQRKIEDLTRKQETEERELNKCIHEINELKESWLPTLRTLVSQINETFSRNFQEMAVAGEVSLDERGVDFDQYGILIKVKFRQAGQLQVLSAHHQSGGERSVSTILYLVSLQDLTNCPFRVVDEINQGMDPINERKMFQQLVRASSLPNTPQCFLLTPKLLPSLDYGEVCSITNIMNGPWIEQASKVWSTGENWGTVMRRTGESHS